MELSFDPQRLQQELASLLKAEAKDKAAHKQQGDRASHYAAHSAEKMCMCGCSARHDDIRLIGSVIHLAETARAVKHIKKWEEDSTQVEELAEEDLYQSMPAAIGKELGAQDASPCFASPSAFHRDVAYSQCVANNLHKSASLALQADKVSFIARVDYLRETNNANEANQLIIARLMDTLADMNQSKLATTPSWLKAMDCYKVHSSRTVGYSDLGRAATCGGCKVCTGRCMLSLQPFRLHAVLTLQCANLLCTGYLNTDNQYAPNRSAITPNQLS